MNDSEIVQRLMAITGASRETLVDEVRRLKESDTRLRSASAIAKRLYPKK